MMELNVVQAQKKEKTREPASRAEYVQMKIERMQKELDNLSFAAAQSAQYKHEHAREIIKSIHAVEDSLIW